MVKYATQAFWWAEEVLKAPDAEHRMSETTQIKSLPCIENTSTMSYGYCRGVILVATTANIY